MQALLEERFCALSIDLCVHYLYSLFELEDIV